MYTEEKYNDIDKLIASYLSNELDEKSFSELKRWSMESETNRIYVRDQLEIWFSSGVLSDKTFFNKNEAFDLFKQRVAEAGRNKRLRRFSWKVIYRVAAVVLLLLLPLATYWQGKEVVKHNFADMVVEAPLGARTKLYLPDGTLVWLNAGSKIVYSQGFGVDDRNLSLEGEGYFEVARDSAKPFIVEAKEVDVRVLGTSFNVNARENSCVTTLVEGCVRMRHGMLDSVELHAGQQALLTGVGKIRVQEVDTRYYTSWMDNMFAFREAPLREIAEVLENWYGCECRFENPALENIPYTTMVERYSDVDSVLQILAGTGDFHYTRIGDLIIIKEK